MDVELRAATVADVPAVAAMVRRAEAHDRVPRVLSNEELSQELAASHLDPQMDTRVAVRGGELVGWAYVWHPPTEVGRDRAELVGEVAPEHRGAGVGRVLLGWSLARARERLAHVVRVSTYEWLDDRRRLLRLLGFAEVRWNIELLRPLHHLPAVPVPPGVSLLPWPDDRDEEIRGARNAAFADHWGSTPVDPEGWRDFVRGHGARPDLSVIAVDDNTGQVLGLCVNQAYPDDEAVTGRRDAWIANLATVRPARGRGVASAMIARSLTAFTEAGFSHAVLEADAENPTGAVQLYRRLGFEHLYRVVVYEIDVVGA
jgi:mycothiol synthase